MKVAFEQGRYAGHYTESTPTHLQKILGDAYLEIDEEEQPVLAADLAARPDLYRYQAGVLTRDGQTVTVAPLTGSRISERLAAIETDLTAIKAGQINTFVKLAPVLVRILLILRALLRRTLQ